MTRSIVTLPRHQAGYPAVLTTSQDRRSARLWWPDGAPSYRERGVDLGPKTAAVLVAYHGSLSSADRVLFEDMISTSKGCFLEACAIAAGHVGEPVAVS
jgi:hypothetical protein